MKNTYANKPQWYIITVIGGKEDSIVANLKERLTTYNYNHFVPEIKIIKEAVKTETVFNKEGEVVSSYINGKKIDPSDVTDKFSKTLKSTKVSKWEVVPEGYKKVSSKVINKFPGYVFVNMIYNQDVWYVIRNTTGVMGFVGSSGQGAKPIPISIYEYEISANENTGTNDVDKVTGEITPQTPAGTQVYETTLVPQMMITINSGQFAGSQGIIKSIDKTTGIASVEIEMFGRSQLVDVEFSDIAE